MANNQGQKGMDRESNQMNKGGSNQQNDTSMNNRDTDIEEPKPSWRPTDEGFDVNETMHSGDQSSSSGAATQRAQALNRSGDPGRTPGKAEGEEDFETGGNE